MNHFLAVLESLINRKYQKCRYFEAGISFKLIKADDTMRIDSITIQNFKVFKNTTVKNLPKMAVLLGTNGSGKSTFFEVFGLLSDALQHNVTVALNKRGGFQEVLSRGSDVNKDFIQFEIKFRNLQTTSATGTRNQETKSPLVTYLLKIGFKQGKAFIDREILKYRFKTKIFKIL